MTLTESEIVTTPEFAVSGHMFRHGELQVEDNQVIAILMKTAYRAADSSIM